MANGATQPGTRLRRVFELAKLPVALQENILRQFFRYLAVAQEAQREAEHHRLVPRDDIREINLHTGYYGQPLQELADGRR